MTQRRVTVNGETFRATPSDEIGPMGIGPAVHQSRAWLMKRWETADLYLLHIKLLRHADLLERTKARWSDSSMLFVDEGNVESMRRWRDKKAK